MGFGQRCVARCLRCARNRLKTQEANLAATRWLRNRSPKAHLQQAVATGSVATASSAGVGVTAAPWAGLAAKTPVFEDTWSPRVAAGELDFGIGFNVLSCSIYLQDGEGFSETNRAILAFVLRLALFYRLPLALAGDWQTVTAKALAQSA